MTDHADAFSQAKAHAVALEIAAIRGASLALQTTEYAVEFAIDPPVDFEYEGVGMVRATGVRAVVHHFQNEEGEPYVHVTANVRPLTARGEPSKRESGYWRPMPTDLAPLLFGKAAIS